jgi:hypothetical protein
MVKTRKLKKINRKTRKPRKIRKTRKNIYRKTRKIKAGNSGNTNKKLSISQMTDIVVDFIKLDLSDPITEKETQTLQNVFNMLSGNNESCITACSYISIDCISTCKSRKYYLYNQLKIKYEILLKKYGMTDKIETLFSPDFWGEKTKTDENKELLNSISPQLLYLKNNGFIDYFDRLLSEKLTKHYSNDTIDKNMKSVINDAWIEWNKNDQKNSSPQ